MFYFLNTVSTISGKCYWRKPLSIKSAWNQNNINKGNKLTALYNMRMRPWEWTKNWSSKQKEFIWGKGGVGHGCKLVTETEKWWKQRPSCKTYCRTATLQYSLMAIHLCIDNSGDSPPITFPKISYLISLMVTAVNTLRPDWMQQLPNAPWAWTEPSSWCSHDLLDWTLEKRHFLNRVSTTSQESPEITEDIFHWGFLWRGNRKAQVRTSANQTSLTHFSKRKLNLI